MSELFSDIKTVQKRFHIPIMYGHAEVQWVQLNRGLWVMACVQDNFQTLMHSGMTERWDIVDSCYLAYTCTSVGVHLLSEPPPPPSPLEVSRPFQIKMYVDHLFFLFLMNKVLYCIIYYKVLYNIFDNKCNIIGLLNNALNI